MVEVRMLSASTTSRSNKSVVGTVHESVKKELLVTIKRFLDAAPVE